jgi:hypothetical protein
MKQLILTSILASAVAAPVLASNVSSFPPPTPLYSTINIADNSSHSIKVVTVAQDGSALTGDTKPKQTLLPNQSALVTSEGGTYSPPAIQSTISSPDGSCVASREMGYAIKLTSIGTLKCTVHGGTVKVS